MLLSGHVVREMQEEAAEVYVDGRDGIVVEVRGCSGDCDH
jgi:hypothetical protein